MKIAKTRIDRRRWPLAMAAVCALSPTLYAQFSDSAFVYETAIGFSAQPDLDGDGRNDILLIDRASGIAHVGLGGASGYTWLPPQATGIAPVDAVALGQFSGLGMDIAVTGEVANRIHLLRYDGGMLTPLPETVFNAVIGVRELAILEEGKAGSPLVEEIIGYARIGAGGVGQRDYIANDGGTYTSYAPGFSGPAAIERGYRRLEVEKNLAMLGLFMDDGSFDRFRLVFTEAGSFDSVDELLVEKGSQVIVADFDGSGLRYLLFHVPGSDSMQVARWDGSGIKDLGSESLGVPIAQVVPYFSDDGPGFLAARSDGKGLRFYAYDGSGKPVLQGENAAIVGAAGQYLLALEDSTFIHFGTQLRAGVMVPTAPRRWVFSGNKFQDLGALPYAPPAVTSGSNVLFFNGAPFIEDTALLSGKASVGVWTQSVTVGSPSKVVSATAQDPSTGVGALEAFSIEPPGGSTHALVNQVGAAMALYDGSGYTGALPGVVNVEPETGTYAQSVWVQFSEVGGLTVYHRVLPSGTWQSGLGPFGPFSEAVEIQYFGAAGDARTPLQSVQYLFSAGPDALDSDADGIPDYVETAYDLDAVDGGDDQDGDGYSDLLELLMGSLANDPTSMPPSRELDSDGDGYSDLEENFAGTSPILASSTPSDPGILNLQAVFDIVAVPQSHNGTVSATPLRPSLSEDDEVPGDPKNAVLATDIRAYRLDGALLGFARTADNAFLGLTDPSALIDGLRVEEIEVPLLVGTAPNFRIQTLNPDPNIGRELVGLLAVPEVDPGAVPYSFGGGDPLLEAANWVAAARTHYFGRARERTQIDLDYTDSLQALLLERKLSEILRARSVLEAGEWATLTGFRASEGAVGLADRAKPNSRPVVVPMATLQGLRHKTAVDNGYRLNTLAAQIRAALATPKTGTIELLAVAEALHRIAAAQFNATPGAYLPPLDALRQFIQTGSLLGTGYLDEPQVAPLDNATLATAYAAVIDFAGTDGQRPLASLALRVPVGGFTGDCVTAQRVDTGNLVELRDHEGRPYPLPDGVNLPVGTEFTATGYTDIPVRCGASLAMEIIPPLAVNVLPVTQSIDLNGDLIDDSLVDLYGAGLSAFGDSDGDDFTDLQEMLDGTDPTDPDSYGSGDAVDLGPPVVEVEEWSGSSAKLKFSYPSAYAGALRFALYASDDLNSFVRQSGVEAVPLGGGQFGVTLNTPPPDGKFYRFRMELRAQ